MTRGGEGIIAGNLAILLDPISDGQVHRQVIIGEGVGGDQGRDQHRQQQSDTRTSFRFPCGWCCGVSFSCGHVLCFQTSRVNSCWQGDILYDG